MTGISRLGGQTAVLLTASVSALFAAENKPAEPIPIPADRLVAEVNVYVSSHSDDAEAYYVLGRIHSLASWSQTDQIPVLRPAESASDELARLRPFWMDDPPAVDGAATGRDPRRLEHLTAAVINHSRAVRMARRNPRYYLGLARAVEHGIDCAGLVPAVPGYVTPPPPRGGHSMEIYGPLLKQLASTDRKAREEGRAGLRLRFPESVPLLFRHRDDADARLREEARALLSEFWREKAIACYLRATLRSIDEDLKIEHRPAEGLRSLIGFEAGTNYLRMVRERGPREVEMDLIMEISNKLGRLDGKPERSPAPAETEAGHPAGANHQ